MSEQISAELVLPEALIACGTLRHRVVPAVPEQQYPFFAAQVVGSLAIEMKNLVAAKDKWIPRRYHLLAPRALSPGHFLL